MNSERLLKLAKHLENGKLGHRDFDFSQWNTGYSNHNEKGFIRGYNKKGCGTAGCAIGECPIVFPKDWCFGVMEKMPLLRDSGHVNSEESARVFFDLTHQQVQHLFVFYSQNTELYGGTFLTGKATRQEVASNIREFVEKMKNGTKK